MIDISSISLFAQGDKVFLYDSKYQKHPGKLQMHWLGPFIVAEIHEYGAVRLAQLNGILYPSWVNGACLKPYIFLNKHFCDNPPMSGVAFLGRISLCIAIFLSVNNMMTHQFDYVFSSLVVQSQSSTPDIHFVVRELVIMSFHS
jgi:hypothetical protein